MYTIFYIGLVKSYPLNFLTHKSMIDNEHKKTTTQNTSVQKKKD